MTITQPRSICGEDHDTPRRSWWSNQAPPHCSAVRGNSPAVATAAKTGALALTDGSTLESAATAAVYLKPQEDFRSLGSFFCVIIPFASIAKSSSKPAALMIPSVVAAG